MAMKDLKGWDFENKRWRWLIKGEYVQVTCQQLGLPEDQWTKEGSLKAAYEWKMEFKGQKAIELQRQHPHAAHLEKLKERFQIATDLGLDTSEIKAEIEETERLPEYETAYLSQSTIAKMAAAELILGIDLSEIDSVALNAFFGSDEIWHDRKRRSGRVEIGKTIGDASRRFLEGKQDESRLGTRSADGADNIRRWLGKFVDFTGDLAPIDSISFELWERWQRACKAKSLKTQTEEAAKEYQVSKTFIRWLWKQDLLSLPKNYDDKMRFNRWTKDIVIYEIADIKKTLALASGQTKLHILLMLNAGMTQIDISKLRKSQISFENGTITRKRSKTELLENTPLVCYPLWTETLEELKKHFSKHPTLALTTKSGQDWVRKQTLSSGKLKKCDNVATQWGNLKKANPKATFLRTLKSLKKTSSTLIFNNRDFSMYHQLFLGHSAKTISLINYSKFDQAIFRQAIMWLAEQFGLNKATRKARAKSHANC